MIFLTILLIGSILGAVFGARKPWMGGVAGLLAAPTLFYFSTSLGMTSTIVGALVFVLLSTAYGYIASILISGLKGGGHNTGQTYVSGFGAHHPGGIILSDEELKGVADTNKIKRVAILGF